MRLEPEVWDALEEMCARESTSLREIVERIDGAGTGGRTSAVRVHVLGYFRAAATELGHRTAGHGSIPAQPAAVRRVRRVAAN
jgi:predicted DNA-binding ribbon-helix-helix protein